MTKKTATILHDVSMLRWPPDSHLIRVSPPVKEYQPLTGDVIAEHEYLALQIPRPEMNETEAVLYPANKDGTFVEGTLNPLLKWTGSVLHSVLKSMGYQVTN